MDDMSETERATLVRDILRYLTLEFVRGDLPSDAAQTQDAVREHFGLTLDQWTELLPLLERGMQREYWTR